MAINKKKFKPSTPDTKDNYRTYLKRVRRIGTSKDNLAITDGKRVITLGLAINSHGWLISDLWMMGLWMIGLVGVGMKERRKVAVMGFVRNVLDIRVTGNWCRRRRWPRSIMKIRIHTRRWRVRSHLAIGGTMV